MAVNAQIMLDGYESGSTILNVGHEANSNAIVTQIFIIFKDYNIYITASLILPDGNCYDRIFTLGGGNCYFYAVCQGLKFFGISINHVHLRTLVGVWLQNSHNARLVHTNLKILSSGLYHYLKRFPSPPGGWVSYLSGMT